MPVVLALPFVLHASSFGLRGLTTDLSVQSHLFSPGHPAATTAIFAHMLAGALITLLAPLQLLAPLRARFPAIHRWSGYTLFAGAIVAGLGGLAYIALRHTIGGPMMDFAFAGYGVCLLIAALQTVRLARARNFERHQEWGLRLFVLAIGSWLYRLQYQLWYLATGGLWMEPNFSGPFDQFQLFAFYVPYLIGLEIWFRLRRRPLERPAV